MKKGASDNSKLVKKSTSLSTNAVAKKSSSGPFPTDEKGDIIPGTYKTRVGEVKIKKIQPAKSNDIISMARAMNDDQFAPRLKQLFSPEQEAVNEAMASGLYISYRPIDPPWNQQDCFRVSSTGRCFCSHVLHEHEAFTGREVVLKCAAAGCPCRSFAWVPSRPEESGEFWLRKRPDFDAAAYRARCHCKHTHEQHRAHPRPHRCAVSGCACSAFNSAFVCASCNRHWHQHETVFETEKERRQAGRPVGRDWLPFAEMPELAQMALTGVDNPDVDTLYNALPAETRRRMEQDALEGSKSRDALGGAAQPSALDWRGGGNSGSSSNTTASNAGRSTRPTGNNAPFRPVYD